ncbi:hypothetical protein RIF29_21272 [Crotalaria pallida]|uniref:Uncharacterized protein n=1 Tax=Crotalaria pallida TaxID=3830 RepID=A0AAN9ID88_CROPI
MGASWLHGVCNENPLTPLKRSLGIKLYLTSGDDSILYDHDLERQQGLVHEVLQWYICRLEAWFSADADMLSLKTCDQASE